MHKTKLLKLLGISLIVGILGLTGFCNNSGNNNSGNNNNLPVVVGVAQQQAAQAAYEAANNTDNPPWFCAIVGKFGTTYDAFLTPLVEQDCNINYFSSSVNANKQYLLNIIDGDQDLNDNCSATRNAIENFNFSNFPGGVGPSDARAIYVNGRSLLDEVRLDPTVYTVISPNTFKLFYSLIYIKVFASDNDLDSSNGNQTETSCVSVVNTKLDSIDYNKFCSKPDNSVLGLQDCGSNSAKTKVVNVKCYYGSGVPSGSTICATLNDQFYQF
jgi:hypothetical protein